MTTTVTRLPTRVEHSTASIAGAMSTLYGTSATKIPQDATLRQIAQEVESQFGLLSQQTQSDIYLARVRELTIR
jgi:hypothetical protein